MLSWVAQRAVSRSQSQCILLLLLRLDLVEVGVWARNILSCYWAEAMSTAGCIGVQGRKSRGDQCCDISEEPLSSPRFQLAELS